jgi:hypothetical protein
MRSSRPCSLLFLVSIVCAVPAGTRALEVADEAPLVRLSLIDLHGLTADVSGRASAEAVDLLDRLGARLEVRPKQPSDLHDPRDLLVVVMPGDPGPLLERGVLGSVQRDAPTRALWVFPRTIARALGLAPLAETWTAAERACFATALARVMAHEIVHLTCPWRDHDRSGLMAARMSRATLRGDPLDLDDGLRRDFVLGASAQAGRSPATAALAAASVR